MARKIEGRNPVYEIIKSGKIIFEVLIAEGVNKSNLEATLKLIEQKGIQLNYIPRHELDKMATSNNHQGIIAFVEDYQYYALDEIIDSIEGKGFFIICDSITDPHNLGAILRTADAAGVDGVIIPKDRSAEITPVVTKVSVGASEYIPVCKVTNIARTIEKLKDAGFWITGADMAGDRKHYEADLKGNVGLVIGSEGKGIRPLVKEKCDFLVKIPMKGNVESLNASVAASILMYEVVRQNDG